jgi:hypothetical protein
MMPPRASAAAPTIAAPRAGASPGRCERSRSAIARVVTTASSTMTARPIRSPATTIRFSGC